jgi:hypothetical protein
MPRTLAARGIKPKLIISKWFCLLIIKYKQSLTGDCKNEVTGQRFIARP